jgi:asparagine synthase (glutamine-hydrolysing)
LHSVDESDDIHIVVNGELYYEPELRAQLEKEYSFRSTSDSEMVIPLYKRYGTGFVDYLRGEFSLVVYDGKTQTLVAARDRFGVKPLHYGIFDGKLLIATQCKGVVELLNSEQDLEWDVEGLAQGGGHYGNRTIFKGIRKVPQGHITIHRQGQAEPLEFKPYYQTKYPANQGGDDDRSADQLTLEARDLLLEAVRIRLDSTDVPVGILLSGGVDSSTIAGMASHLARQRLDTTGGKAPPLPTCFTIAFPDDSELDESSIAARTAEHLGLSLEKVVVSEQTLADEFDEACWP